MNPEFIAILQKLIAEQGKEVLQNPSKCKALLADYTRGEYKKESRLLLQALDANVQKAISTAKNIAICKKQQIRLLHEEYSIDEKVAADVVDKLALMLRGDALKSKDDRLNESGGKKVIKKTAATTTVFIPKMFSDKVINDELAKVEKSLIEIKHELEVLQRLKLSSENEESRAKNEKDRLFNERVARQNWALGFGPDPQEEIAIDRIGYFARQKMEHSRKIWEKDSLKLEYELKKSDLEALLRKTPRQRAEDHYQQLLDEKNAITDENELPNLISKLREMEGYKDTEALAKECEGMVFKIQYD